MSVPKGRWGVELRILVMTAVAMIGGCIGAAAQTEEGGPDPAAVAIQFGPLWVTPRLQLTNFGVDSNVFNAPNGQEQKDVTATVSPSADVWLRFGESWLQVTVREDAVWFQKYVSERSANTNYTAKVTMPLNRLRVVAAQTYLHTHERPGFEIDARAQRTEYGGEAAADVRGFAKTYFGVSGTYRKIAFNNDAVFLGENLHDQLNHVSTTAGAYVRYQVTPLTQFTFTLSQAKDRFAFSSLRDANTTDAAFTVTFDPHAVIHGAVTVGYRHFRPLVPGLAEYIGSAARGDLTYSLLGVTRFQAQFKRDIGYSYDINQPYYLETGVTGSVAQQIFGPLDVVGRGGYSQLAYRDRFGALVAVSNRSDYIHSHGGGVGYHVGKDVRIGFNVDQQHRLSPDAARQYDDLRFGTSITYGF